MFRFLQQASHTATEDPLWRFADACSTFAPGTVAAAVGAACAVTPSPARLTRLKSVSNCAGWRGVAVRVVEVAVVRWWWCGTVGRAVRCDIPQMDPLIRSLQM